MLYNYAIFDLRDDNFEERVEDIVDVVNRKICALPLMMLQITPIRTPIVDILSEQLRIYKDYSEALKAKGIDLGVLLHTTLLHEEIDEYAPFQPLIKLSDGEKVAYPYYCPSDKNFIENLKCSIRQIVSLGPKAVMLDDDFNMMMQFGGKGCACPYHMSEFNRRANTNMTRGELFEHLKTSPRGDKLKKIYIDLMTETITNAAKELRSAIDEIDPSVQGILCTSGHYCDAAAEISKTFCGKGNPSIVRIPNGNYAPYSIRGFSELIALTAKCKAKVKQGGVDVVICESDTIPNNRYSKSSRYLHSHYVTAMLDGLQGGKQWLNRHTSFEKLSGKAYREILAKHQGLYNRLFSLSSDICWFGINCAFTVQEEPLFDARLVQRFQPENWAVKNFEEMGLPFFFSNNAEPANFFEGNMVDTLTDQEIEKFFEGSVFLDCFSAEKLIKRGYGHLLGVSISDWDLGTAHGECFNGDFSLRTTAQYDTKKISVVNKDVEVLSHLYRCANNFMYSKNDKSRELLAPAVTRLKRDNGKYTVVFCGSPDASFNYRVGFSFMNETRKNQLINLLRDANALPLYAVGDDELCVRAGYLGKDKMICSVIELGTDPLDELTLFIEKQPTSIVSISPDGKDIPVEFTKVDENVYSIKVKVEILYPVTLIIN